jgi:VanZ family protein
LLIYLLIVFFLTIAPLGNNLNLTVQNSYVIERLRLDHLLHGLMFIPFFGLFFRAISIESLIKRFFLALFLSLGVAVIAELLQIFLPYRAFTFPDLQANLVGVFLGMILFGILNIIQHSFQNTHKA